MLITKEQIDKLTCEEKQELLTMVYESMGIEPYIDEEEDETEEELKILEERLEEYKKDPSSAISWEEAYEQLKKRNNAQ